MPSLAAASAHADDARDAMRERVRRWARGASQHKVVQLVARSLRQPLTRPRVQRSTDTSPDLAGLLWVRNDGSLRPADAAAANADLVQTVLDDIDVPYSVVRAADTLRTVVAVPVVHRDATVAGLVEHFDLEPVYVQVLDDDAALDPDAWGSGGLRARWRRRARLVSRSDSLMRKGSVLRIAKLYRHEPSGLEYPMHYGCDIEFWDRPQGGHRWIAPRSNVAARELSDDDVTFAPKFRHRPHTPSVFDRTMIDDIDFSIDAVYTWVDDSDPAWRAKLEHHRVQSLDEVHSKATAAERFRSRDELRYSLRSLSMYAPWVRHVYIVTDAQRPDFLDFEHDGITLVDHKDIAPDPTVLPVFNSNAIIGWLHRIPGLSEHYLYMNDDFFFGGPVQPDLFFTPSGLCRVFPSRNQRPFGPPTPQDAPHINLTRNMRALIESEFGRTPSHSIRHTPYPQRVSIHEEMSKRFHEALTQTSRNRFRHHEDVVADQLHHYFAQVTGQAVRGGIRYAYANVGDKRSLPELLGIESRSVDVFCLNDAPEPGVPRIPDEVVVQLLERLFPIPSAFEK